MTDLISRQMAIKALRKMLYKLEEEREEYYIKEKKIDEWFIYIRPNVQDMNDLDVETIDSLPSASPWHTGTPAEEGWYVIKTKHGSLFLVQKNSHGFWIEDKFGYEALVPTEGYIVAWRKIEPYKED